jgi:hypothetical protein
MILDVNWQLALELLHKVFHVVDDLVFHPLQTDREYSQVYCVRYFMIKYIHLLRHISQIKLNCFGAILYVVIAQQFVYVCLGVLPVNI